MRRKILLTLEVLLVLAGMLTAQACFEPPGPYGYYGGGYGYGAPGPGYGYGAFGGPDYGYGHPWHRDWDD